MIEEIDVFDLTNKALKESRVEKKRKVIKEKHSASEISKIEYEIDRGKNLDKWINDKEYWVRAEVAEQGYALDKLINDDSFWVRHAVAEQGYGLEQLVNDSNAWVRQVARDMLSKQNKRESFKRFSKKK